MTIADELARLEELRNNGSLTEIEFEAAKRKVLEENAGAAPQAAAPHGAAAVAPGGAHSGGASNEIFGLDERLWCILMHLSQLLVYSLLGIVVPIGMWLAGKDESDLVRRNGNAMMNWFISSMIYKVIAGLLCFVFIGFFLLPLIALLDIVFPIIAAFKAKEGQAWSYPMSIRFLDET